MTIKKYDVTYLLILLGIIMILFSVVMSIAGRVLTFFESTLLISNLMLIMVTLLYVMSTHDLANTSRKQTDASSMQIKIASIEKKLERVYNPIYELSRTSITADGCDEDTRYIEGSEYNHICHIFKTYSYLITNKKIITRWETANEGNNPMLIIDKSMYLDMVFINLINKERNKLIIEYKKLINAKNQIK